MRHEYVTSLTDLLLEEAVWRFVAGDRVVMATADLDARVCVPSVEGTALARLGVNAARHCNNRERVEQKMLTSVNYIPKNSVLTCV